MDETQNMTPENLILLWEYEYRRILTANPDFDWTLWDFLIDKGVEPDDILKYAPEIGHVVDESEEIEVNPNLR